MTTENQQCIDAFESYYKVGWTDPTMAQGRSIWSAAWQAALASPAAEPAVPAGWKLVPVEPTRKMRAAAHARWEKDAAKHDGLLRDRAYYGYRAMLAAAPQPLATNTHPVSAPAKDMPRLFIYMHAETGRNTVINDLDRQAGWEAANPRWQFVCEAVPVPESFIASDATTNTQPFAHVSRCNDTEDQSANPLYVHALNCPHTITHDEITLRYDPAQPGKNALAQLADRLAAAGEPPCGMICRRADLYGKACGVDCKRDAMEAVAEQPSESTTYVECRECRECDHVGINDAHPTDAACGYPCGWSGPEPSEDKCPSCKNEGVMSAACPKCGGLYRLIAQADITPAAVAQQVALTGEQENEFVDWMRFAHMKGLEGRLDLVRAIARALLAHTGAQPQGIADDAPIDHHPVGTFACPICGHDKPHSHTETQTNAYREDQLRHDGWTSTDKHLPKKSGWYLYLGVEVPRLDQEHVLHRQQSWFLWVREYMGAGGDIPEVLYFDQFDNCWYLRNALGDAVPSGAESRRVVCATTRYWRVVPNLNLDALAEIERIDRATHNTEVRDADA